MYMSKRGKVSLDPIPAVKIHDEGLPTSHSMYRADDVLLIPKKHSLTEGTNYRKDYG